MKLLLHKIKHWEYWPVYVVYLPNILICVYYAIRFRNFFYFKKANPMFPNGGLYNVSKNEIYKLIPNQYLPKTIYIRKNENPDFYKLLKLNNLSLPVIVKPDKGKRGIKVEKIYTFDEIQAYHLQNLSDYFIQEQVDFENEIGLFYCRLPNEKHGTITGIVGKEFMKVKGDGRSTIQQLMYKNNRYASQIDRIFDTKPKLLEQVLNVNENLILEPIGNHNRGTKFIDESYRITTQLTNSFDIICSKIEGFYYGRLDIKFANWSELEAGKNFKILEINGAMSEPAHIYDPKHSFWYGQKEIFRHLKIMRNIVKHFS